jgi:hypothetical protein
VVRVNKSYQNVDDNRTRFERNQGRAALGATYHCPKCELATLSLEPLRDHWIRTHADEYGLFCHADIEVKKGP